MGWGTSLFTDIYFNKETIDNKYQVEEKISEIKKFIEDRERYIEGLVMCTEPKKLFDIEDGGNVIETLNMELNQVLFDLHESYIELYKYKMLLDEWDNCHVTLDNGEVVARSIEGKTLEYGQSYLDGDFIKTDRKDEDNLED